MSVFDKLLTRLKHPISYKLGLLIVILSERIGLHRTVQLVQCAYEKIIKGVESSELPLYSEDTT